LKKSKAVRSDGDLDALGLEAIELRQQRENKILEDRNDASYKKKADIAGSAEFPDAETFTDARLTAERQKGIMAMEDKRKRPHFLTNMSKG
jgi:hypothetical protein